MIEFPLSTIVGKPVPKAAFYRHLDIGARLKARFVEDIESIAWEAKLAPSTLNVDNGKAVNEIAVFRVELRKDDAPLDVLALIDRQMPRHALFVLQHESRQCLLMNYKEWADESKLAFSIISTFRTEWTDGQRLQLTIRGSNMDKIYESLAGQISGFGTDNAADTKRIITLQQQLEQKRRAAEALQKKVRAEKQFSRQMMLNAEARAMKRELDKLSEEMSKVKSKYQ